MILACRCPRLVRLSAVVGCWTLRVWDLVWSAVAFGRSPTKVPFPPPLSCGGGTGAREPPAFPARYPAGVGAA